MRGVGRVIAFNWPKYGLGLAAVVVAAALPAPLWIVGVVVGGWLLAGLAATWWAYDRSPLYQWTWLTALLPAPPARYAVISTGLDEISPTLRHLLPAAEEVLLDLYDPAITGEGSIRRARAMIPSSPLSLIHI